MLKNKLCGLLSLTLLIEHWSETFNNSFRSSEKRISTSRGTCHHHHRQTESRRRVNRNWFFLLFYENLAPPPRSVNGQPLVLWLTQEPPSVTALSWLSAESGLSPREECHVLSQPYHFSEQVFFRESPRGRTQPAFTCRGDQSPKTGMGFISVQCGVIGDLCSETPQGFGSRGGVCALATGMEAEVWSLLLRCMRAQSHLFAPLWTVACQVPLSIGFSRQECWSGLPCPPPGDLPNQGLNPHHLWLLHCR